MATDPKDCPDPAVHGTFRYCPYCTWTEADDAPPCDAVLGMRDDRWGLIEHHCESYQGHAGVHFHVMGACEPPARLVWLDAGGEGA